MRADSTLLEDLAVGERLALDLEVPRHGTVEELLALFGRDVERRDVVRLPVGGDGENRDGVLASDDKGTRDERVTGLAKDTHGTHGVLSRRLQSGEETTDQIGGHEDLGQFVVVLVVDSPD